MYKLDDSGEWEGGGEISLSNLYFLDFVELVV